MKRCPHCGFDLTRGAAAEAELRATAGDPAGAVEPVSCPECDRPIDAVVA
jgi:endogenous inhibitor of DNA gyrase (YacG/DUF329 family)